MSALEKLGSWGTPWSPSLIMSSWRWEDCCRKPASYPKGRKEVDLPGIRIDLLTRDETTLVVAEVKRHSGQREAQLLQLGYYLLRLKELGLEAQGELRYPEERRIERVTLTPELEARVRATEQALEELLRKPTPPQPSRIPACSGCAYFELCFIGEDDA